MVHDDTEEEVVAFTARLPRALLEALDQDLDRFQYQVEEYCRLVPHAAARAREQADEAKNKLERQREKLLNVIVNRPR